VAGLLRILLSSDGRRRFFLFLAFCNRIYAIRDFLVQFTTSVEIPGIRRV
jgi:hypothetical protein